MSDRTALRMRFLQTSGWADAKSDAMDADASGRSYERLTLNGQTSILMNAPYEAGEDVRPFVAVTNMLIDAELSPPKILAEDIEYGFLLLEDLGDGLFAKLCKTDPDCETQLYETAVDVLVSLHREPPHDLPQYDLATYLREVKLLTEWYLPAATGTPTGPELQTQFEQIVKTICQSIPDTPQVLVMRDYHAENLLWLADQIGIKRVGLLDYQDALAGHPAYDLVSLLQDARRDTSSTLQHHMLQRYLDSAQPEQDAFVTAYNILGMQRNIKILGIFARLCIRDKKAHYVDLLPRVWGHLQENLKHASCAEMAIWFTQNVPAPTPQIIAKIKGAK